MAASTVVPAKDRLLLCEILPKLLCCSEYVLNKYFIDWLNYIIANCPYKMQNYDEFITLVIGFYQKTELQFYNEQITSISIALPIILSMPTIRSIKKSIMFIKPNLLSQKLFELPKASTYQTYDNYIHLNQQYSITKLSQSNLPSHCGIGNSRSPYSTCLSRKLFDKLLLICCQQHVSSNCYNLCTYEHRKYIAVETLIWSIQQNAYDLMHFSNILHCGNRDRDCHRFHVMVSPPKAVDNRCFFHTCSISQSGDEIEIIEKTIWSIIATGMFSCILHAMTYKYTYDQLIKIKIKK
ncbi:Uncharacterized protein BM_BM6973 [Brugia malayi]|nr:Uncharacterized protein BM_BM6973 [Brugia malayi]VIO95558.1 Uncharacterized protein BM_BM6973 [Brugia malayi]